MDRFRAFLARIHWPAIVAFIPTLTGILTDPSMLDVWPAKYSRLLTVSGAMFQLYTKHLWKARDEVTP